MAIAGQIVAGSYERAADGTIRVGGEDRARSDWHTTRRSGLVQKRSAVFCLTIVFDLFVV